MTEKLISFSRTFKQIYEQMEERDKNSVDAALTPLTPVVRAMRKHDLHTHKMSMMLNITGPHGLLHVIITGNPVRAVVKTVKRTGKAGNRFD